MLQPLQQPILLATSIMNRHFVEETERLTKTAIAFDPVLVDQECIFKPKINRKSTELA